jgi:hypothetical protein
MGYFEIVCQLCGVSFAIGRIRRADEPVSTAFQHAKLRGSSHPYPSM